MVSGGTGGTRAAVWGGPGATGASGAVRHVDRPVLAAVPGLLMVPPVVLVPALLWDSRRPPHLSGPSAAVLSRGGGGVLGPRPVGPARPLQHLGGCVDAGGRARAGTPFAATPSYRA